MIVVFFFENKFGCGFCKVTSKSDAKAIAKNVDNCSIGCSVSYVKTDKTVIVHGFSTTPACTTHTF